MEGCGLASLISLRTSNRQRLLQTYGGLRQSAKRSGHIAEIIKRCRFGRPVAYLSCQDQCSLEESMCLRRLALCLGYSPEIAQHCGGRTTQSQGTVQQVLCFSQLAPLGS